MTFEFQIDLEKWAIIFTNRDSRVADKFMETFREIGKKIGMSVMKPEVIRINSDNAKVYCDEIKRMGRLQIVVTIFPSQRDDRYASVKKLCNADLGLPSQVRQSVILCSTLHVFHLRYSIFICLFLFDR